MLEDGSQSRMTDLSIGDKVSLNADHHSCAIHASVTSDQNNMRVCKL